MTTLEARDYDVRQLIYDFKQMKPSQVHEVMFYGLTKMPCYRSLNRLKAQHQITRFEIPSAGGDRGGSGQYIWTPFGVDRKTVDYHALEIGNTYIEFVRLERAGVLTFVQYRTEPECHERIGDIILEPDLYIEVQLANGEHRHFWIEVDMARRDKRSEGSRQLEQKLQRYWNIYTGNSDYWPTYLLKYDEADNPVYEHIEVGGQVYASQGRWFPLVTWIVRDQWRATTLKRLISRMPNGAERLFKVCERSDIARLF